MSDLELTPRQQQILKLLEAGKVNKEIAAELGIGIGTVKQHVVALFRRLNVKNRTMAVSRGLAIKQTDDAAAAAKLAQPTQQRAWLERWPSLVLSVALPPSSHPPQALKSVHRLLSGLAIDAEAVFFARNGFAGEIIFGVQSVSERERQRAFAVAEQALAHNSGLKIGLSCGLALVSLDAQGGWSGEVLATAAIVAARQCAESAHIGGFTWDHSIEMLMEEECDFAEPDLLNLLTQLPSSTLKALPLFLRMRLAAHIECHALDRMELKRLAQLDAATFHWQTAHQPLLDAGLLSKIDDHRARFAHPIWREWCQQSAVDAVAAFETYQSDLSHSC